MKTIFSLLILFFTAAAHATPLTREDLIQRLVLRVDVLVFSEDGKQILELGGENRVLSGFSNEGKYKRDWSSNSTNYGTFRLRHEWTIDPKGVIHVKFEEFSEEEMDSKTGIPKDFKNPIGSEERDVVDFGAVLYRVKGIQGKRVVLRFIPELSSEDRVEKLGRFKLMARGVTIYDAEGAIWASGLEMGAEYSAVSTHRGTLVLSYSPFKGSEPVGVATGKRITIRMKEYPRVTLQSETDFVPEGMSARVFVKYIKERRTEGLNSVKQNESSDEKRILEKLKK